MEGADWWGGLDANMVPIKNGSFCKSELSIYLGWFLRAVYQDDIFIQSNKDKTSCTSKGIQVSGI